MYAFARRDHEPFTPFPPRVISVDFFPPSILEPPSPPDIPTTEIFPARRCADLSQHETEDRNSSDNRAMVGEPAFFLPFPCKESETGPSSPEGERRRDEKEIVSTVEVFLLPAVKKEKKSSNATYKRHRSLRLFWGRYLGYSGAGRWLELSPTRKPFLRSETTTRPVPDRTGSRR